VLPWRVVLLNALRAFRDDPGFRNRLLAFVVVMVLLAGAFTSGFEATIRFGGDDRAGTFAGARAGGGAGIDGELELADGDDTFELGELAADGIPTEGGARPTAAGGRAGGGTGGGAGDPTTEPDGGGGSGGGAAGTAGHAGCEGATLRATDHGVGEDTIKIGILEAHLGPLAELGFSAGVEADYQKILDAWTTELNGNGGVACRQVTYVVEGFDVLSVDSMLAACRRMTQDHKVFAVLTAGGYDSVAQLCIARDNQTPLINTEPQPAHWYAEAAPYLWSTLMSKDRMHRNHIRWLVESGEITSGDRVGVVYHGIPNVGPAVERSLLPELARHGIEPVRVTKLSADDEQALAQISQVVIDFQARRIDRVIMPMNLIFKTQFMQQAEQQAYLPRYTDSDHYFGCFDFVTGTYPARSWESTPCVTSSQVAGMRPGDLEAFADAHPHQQHADAVYLRQHPEGFGSTDDEADVQRAINSVIGTLVLLWAEAADRVGPDITRAAWGQEMGNTGAFARHTAPHPLTFRADKWDGPDHLSVVRWRAAAGDGWDARMYRMVIAPFPAYY
jgi:hypothetical protein